MKIENKTVLIKWLNSHEIPIQRIEELGKGVALCMLLKKIDPTFPTFRKEPVTEEEYFSNLKLVQLYFERRQVMIPLVIEKMVKLKMQDNLQAIQFIYRYVIREIPSFITGSGSNNAETRNLTEKKNGLNTAEIGNTTTSEISEINQSPCKLSLKNNSNFNEQLQELKDQNIKLKSLTEKLKNCSEIIQNERNFYFEKLVQIEEILVNSGTKEIEKEKILKILYKI